MRIALVVCLLASPALADDYPFTGVFSYRGSTTPATELDRLKCAFNFFTQGADGRGRDYMLDLAAYRAGKTIRYVPLDSFLCQYDKLYQTEHCTFSDSADAAMPSQTYSHIESIEPDAVTVAIFNDLAALADYVGGGPLEPDLQPLGQYLRCGGFDAAKLAPYLSAAVPPMSPEAVEQGLGDPFADGPHPELQAIAREVIARIGQ